MPTPRYCDRADRRTGIYAEQRRFAVYFDADEQMILARALEWKRFELQVLRNSFRPRAARALCRSGEQNRQEQKR